MPVCHNSPSACGPALPGWDIFISQRLSGAHIKITGGPEEYRSNSILAALLKEKQ